jgi:hypothetical protein
MFSAHLAFEFIHFFIGIGIIYRKRKLNNFGKKCDGLKIKTNIIEIQYYTVFYRQSKSKSHEGYKQEVYFQS